MTTEGFVLTQQVRQGREGLDYLFWISTAQGPLLYQLQQQEAVFFFLRSDRQQVSDLLESYHGWRMQPVDLLDPQGQPVDALYFQRLDSLYRARELLNRFGVTLLEDDVRPTERYLMERFICGGIKLDQPFPSADLNHPNRPVTLLQAKAAPCNYQPQLRVLSLDIETSMRGDELYCIGLYGIDPDGSTCQQVLMKGHGAGDALIRYCPTERALLQALVEWIAQFDPDLLIGWNVIDFDFRFLQRKAEQLLTPFKIGRDGSTLQFRDTDGRPRVSVAGRLVVDGIDCLKGATYQFESYALEAVAQKLLGRGKQIDHVDQRGEEIGRLYRQNQQALAAYNLQDCVLVWDIFEHAKLLPYLLERTALTGLMLDRIGGSAAAFDNLYLPRLHRAGRVAPPYASGEGGLSSPGGYVMESRPGFYRDVLVLDFKSLYPSLIRSFLVDPLGLFVGLDEETSATVEGFNGARFDRQQHILPGLLATLWQARDRAKRDSNEALSRAIKIIMNSFYGVLGSNQCRFFDHRLSGSITLRGHQVLTESRDYIEAKSNDEITYTVIYGDTDSLFVWLRPQEQQEPQQRKYAESDEDHCGSTISGDSFNQRPAAFEPIDQQAVATIGKTLADALNGWWCQRLADEFGVDSALEIEFETHYQRFLMPTLRGSDRGSKKRYAGLVTADGRSEMVYKGLEAVRTDWTPLAREFQQQLYRRIFLDLPFEEYLLAEVAALMAGERDDKLVYSKRLRRPLAEYVKSQPPHIQAARIAERNLQQQDRPSHYRRGTRSSYLITTQGAQPEGQLTAPIDYSHYLEKQLMPVADAILPFVGGSFGALVERQIALF
ncbi:MAG: DNA polymerase II [Motiliproteus sp.]